MSKLRSVSTSFWSDPFVEDLTPTEKLLFLYLITNERTNMLGIYEASISKMSFETGIDKKTIKKALEGFERVGKVKYRDNFVLLINYMKHQKYNLNMKKSAIKVYNELPKDLIDNKLELDTNKPSEAFESLLNHLGMVSKIEIEYEVEEEIENEEEKLILDRYNNYLSLFNSIKKTEYPPLENYKDVDNNFKYWIKVYTPSKIKKAIENHDENFWMNPLCPFKLMRRRSRNQQKVDYIGDLLQHKAKPKFV
jgi:hypothetical protein